MKIGDKITEDEVRPLWAITKYMGIGISYDGENDDFRLETAPVASNSSIHIGILRDDWHPGAYGSGVYFNYAHPRSGEIKTAWIIIDNAKNDMFNTLIVTRGSHESIRDSQQLLNFILRENPKVLKLLKTALPPNSPQAIELRAK